MNCVREKVRLGHLGSRGRYNGKKLGSNYISGKRNSAVSFMFFNFPEEWGMGRMWMIFKRYGTVFDMFMAKRRLRNGKRYGFRNNGNMEMGEGHVRRETGGHNANSGGSYRGDGLTYNKDNRRFVDVVNGEHNRDGAKSLEKETKGINVQPNGKEGFTLLREENGTRRTIKVDENDINVGILSRCVVEEVKALCFLAKLPMLYKEQGLEGTEVKLLGGLEVLLVMENEIMAANVLSDKEHGMRRWLYKLRKGESVQRTAGRITWISILGIPFSCWSEGVFKKIAAIHGTILALHNCRMEGNQNLTYGRVKIHTINKGLISEELNVQVKGKIFKIKMLLRDISEKTNTTEIRDITVVDLQEVTKKRCVDEKINEFWDGNDLQVDDEEGVEGESNSEGDESSDDENDDGKKVVCDDGNVPPADSGDRNIEEDEASRVSGESKVGDTFIGGESNVTRMKVSNTYGLNCIGHDMEIPNDDGIGLASPIENNFNGKNIISPLLSKMCGGDKDGGGGNCGEERYAGGDQDCRREKREVSPSSSTVSEGDRLRKKRKANNEEIFEGKVGDMNFNQGKPSGDNYGGKRKSGRRSVTKAIEMARKIGVEGLGENKKRSVRGDSVRCDVNIEQVKEIGEIIGVSWTRAVEEERWKDQCRDKEKEGGNDGQQSKFTRVSDDGLKFSKLDRFLLNDQFNELWGNLSVVSLDKKLSDHCPIVMKDVELDFGPKPFKVFNIWMDEPDFLKVVGDAWMKEVKSFRPDCRFRDRLKNVKASLIVWSKDRFGGEMFAWLEARKQWEISEKEHENMLRQKSRFRWDVEGDENSKFFHAFVRRRNNKCNHRGLMVDGVWCEDPKGDKAPGPNGFNFKFIKMAWDIIKSYLVCAVQWFWDKMEILKGCNASFITIIPKVTDPICLIDFRPISLIGCYYKIIVKMLAERVKCVVGYVVGEEQNAFIKDRFILDGVLIANETMEYLKKKKEKSLIFKVDFEKAYDSINWRFLLDIMKRMRFGEK
ncbi:transposon TX1 [Tanacetum coccineum]